MRYKRRPTDITSALLSGLAILLLAEAALAQHGANRRSSASAGASNQRSTTSRPAPPPQPASRLLPPAGLGSAAGAPPGFYRRHLSVPQVDRSPRQGRGPVFVPYPSPYPVYVLPPELAVSPSQVVAPSLQDDRRLVAPRQPPPPQVIVIQQPAAAPQPMTTPPAVRQPPPLAPPRSTEPAAVAFSIAPPTAQVFLDGELLGTGAELDGRPAMMLRPGVYVLEVTHPDYRFQRLVFGVQADEPMEVVVDLTVERVGRRSRIR